MIRRCRSYLLYIRRRAEGHEPFASINAFRGFGRSYKTASELNRNWHDSTQFLSNLPRRVRHQRAEFQDALVGQPRNRAGQ